ncbi:O-antigen ligase family protein [Streptomyces formicae]|uniref:O-antigen ligase family protein n=1 Tax=Streptomyces formicae TaxID=1616117 RepID=A0ABY3WGV3_9ACTN|nr:O-antigen ligase family protein [Streptomyces formicae]UNM11395.1 O-antigen ligase family protein [Streptomyces formicae]
MAERTAQSAVVLVGLIGYGAVLTTFSRAGYVAAAAGLLVLGTAYWLAPRLGRRGRRVMAALGVAVVAAGAAGIWMVSRAGKSLGVRGQAWQAAVDTSITNPLGVGLGRSGAVISAVAPGERQFVHAHNLWLNWLVEVGAVGLLAIVLVTVVAYVSAARAAREKSVIGTVGLAALTGFFLMSMADHPANLVRMDTLFWLVLGLVMAEAPVRRRRSGTPAPAGRPRHGPHQRARGTTPLPQPARPAAEPVAVRGAAPTVR